MCPARSGVGGISNNKPTNIMSPETTLKPLLGQTIEKIEGAEPGQEYVLIDLADGRRFGMSHEQDCCENVAVHSVAGNLQDIIGSPVVSALEIEGDPEGVEYECSESHTFTSFRITTAKGTAEIRWLGESNGYYGEGVSFSEVSR
jgi:hypothetical protein